MANWPWFMLGLRARDPDWHSYGRRQSLTSAVEADNVDELRSRLQLANAAGDLTPSRLANVLVLCSKHDHRSAAQMVLQEFGADMKIRIGRDKTSALMVARSKEMVDLLLQHVAAPERAAIIDSTDVTGRTALVCAVVNENIKGPETLHVITALIRHGAKIDQTDISGTSALMHALKEDKPEVASKLLDEGAPHDSTDTQRRNALMSAAWRNHVSIFERLLGDEFRADIKAVDDRSRSVLHHICQDRHRAKRSQSADVHPDDDSIVEAILSTDLDVNGKDEALRTALHFAVDANNIHLVDRLLNCGRVELDATDKESWTPLHCAIGKNHVHLAKMLIASGARVDVVTEQGWTALHLATIAKGSRALIPLILAALSATSPSPAEIDLQSRIADYINSGAEDDKTALHLASETGNYAAVELLLAQASENPKIDVAIQDSTGNTAMFIAAKSGQKRIVELLAHFTYAALTAPALDASRGFLADIVDFTPGDGGVNITSHDRKRVHHLITGDIPITPEGSAQGTNVSQSPGFRWIHVPSNNLSWCQELICRHFLEREDADPEIFKALQMSFNNEHVGTQPHSRYMRPVCRLVHRSRPFGGPETRGRQSASLPVSSRNQLLRPSTDSQSPFLGEPFNEYGSLRQSEPSPISRQRAPMEAFSRGTAPGRLQINTPTSTTSRSPPRTPSGTHQTVAPITPDAREASPGQMNDGRHVARHSMYLFMPYIHYETVGALRHMQNEIKSALLPEHKPPRVVVKDPVTARVPDASLGPTTRRSTWKQDQEDADKKLIRAHVYQSNASVHVRRTLDQSFYRTIDTKVRDRDQVVLRYQKKHKKELHRDKCKLLMVDQCWMWIVEGELLITSFPKRWEQSDRDSDLFKSLLSELRMPVHEHVSDIYQLSMFIASHCAGMTDVRSTNRGETLFLDMFDEAIGHVTDQETELFRRFESASEEASQWLQDSRSIAGMGPKKKKLENDAEDDNEPEDLEHYQDARGGSHLGEWSPEPPFIHTLLDIKSETKLTKEIKDIGDELGMLSNIFTQQQAVCEDAYGKMTDVLHGGKQIPLHENGLQKVYDELMRRIQNPQKDIKRMQEHAKTNYDAIKDLLDLKQKYANAMQAADVARQSQTILVFTIVTVLFLPLSFLATFFALPIRVFPRRADGTVEMPVEYVLKYVLGVGLLVSLPFILVALTLKNFRWIVKESRKWVNHVLAQRALTKKERKRVREEVTKKRRDEKEARMKAKRASEQNHVAASTANVPAVADGGSQPTHVSGRSPASFTKRFRRVFAWSKAAQAEHETIHANGSV